MEGVRVLEVAEHTFVPAASALLADWGPRSSRSSPPSAATPCGAWPSTGVMPITGDVHPLIEHSNRGKRSLALDLTTPEGLDILYKLAATCDVFLTNKLPRVRKKLKIELEDLRAHNPNIIYVAGTGPGRARSRRRQGLVRLAVLLVPGRRGAGREAGRHGATCRARPARASATPSAP